jgi:hypothetical protein
MVARERRAEEEAGFKGVIRAPKSEIPNELKDYLSGLRLL